MSFLTRCSSVSGQSEDAVLFSISLGLAATLVSCLDETVERNSPREDTCAVARLPGPVAAEPQNRWAGPQESGALPSREGLPVSKAAHVFPRTAGRARRRAGC